jgi:hypothetical protein
MIIGINGKIGSGKDTVGKIIQYLQCHNTGQITIEDVISNPEHEWWLEEQSDFEIKKFASKLKQIASLLTGVDVENFENQEFKKQYMELQWGMTYREFLQKIGTEAMRDGLHTNVWVNALFADYKAKWVPTGNAIEEDEVSIEKQYPNWIVTDMRFENELEAVVEREGITIRVVRPGTVVGNHPSETALDGFIMHYEIINDGTLEELVEKVREILKKENII